MSEKNRVGADQYMGYNKKMKPASPKIGYQDGGPVAGPSTPPDSVDIKATGGEYIFPAEVVRFKGTKFFDDILKGIQMEMSGGGQAGPGANPFLEMAQNDMGEMEPGGGPSRPPRRA